MTTKTVQGFFGPKQVTREEFIKEWTSHFMEFYSLCETTQDFAELDAIKVKMIDLAGKRWDSMKY